MDLIFGLLFSGIFLLSGFFVAKRHFEEFKEGMGSFFWPSVKGTIDNSISYNIREGRGVEGGKYYYSNIFYNYIIDGKEFSSRRIRVGEESISYGFKWRIKRTINKYKRRGDIRVFYNPNNPQEAVLKRGPPFIVNFSFLFGTFWILISLVILLFTIGSNLQ